MYLSHLKALCLPASTGSSLHSSWSAEWAPASSYLWLVQGNSFFVLWLNRLSGVGSFWALWVDILKSQGYFWIHVCLTYQRSGSVASICLRLHLNMEGFKIKQTILPWTHSKPFCYFVQIDLLLNKLQKHIIRGVVMNYHIRKLKTNEPPLSLNTQILTKCYILKVVTSSTKPDDRTLLLCAW